MKHSSCLSVCKLRDTKDVSLNECCPLSAAKLIPFDKEMKFEIGDTDYNAVKSLDNKVDSGEKVEDISEEN